jgi:hypothetical protein
LSCQTCNVLIVRGSCSSAEVQMTHAAFVWLYKFLYSRKQGIAGQFVGKDSANISGGVILFIFVALSVVCSR